MVIVPLPLLAVVTLQTRVATVEAVVRELAEKSGQHLRVVREMADEVLDVDLKPRKPGALMRLVADAAGTEWTDDGGLRLGRSPSTSPRPFPD